jgi:hypothetical protein
MVEKQKVVKKDNIIKTFFLSLVPIILGLMLWFGLSYQISIILKDYIPNNIYVWLSIPRKFPIILVAICILYGFLIKIFCGWPNVIWYFVKMFLVFPIYLLVMIITFVVMIVRDIIKIIRKGWRIFSSPIIILVFICLSISLIIISTKVNNTNIYSLTMYILPFCSFCSILWLYVWTFYPFNSFSIIDKIVNIYLSFWISPYMAKPKLIKNDDILSELIKKDKVKEYNEKIKTLKSTLSKISTIIGNLRVEPLLMNVFVLLFLLVFSLVCFDFAQSYYCIYLINPNSIEADVTPTLFHFIMLSFRTIFFNDYFHMLPISQNILNIILLESIAGICLFVVLIMSFSNITNKQGKEAKKAKLINIQRRINSILLIDAVDGLQDNSVIKEENLLAENIDKV